MLDTYIDQLKKDGYWIVKNAINADTITTMLQKIEYLYEDGSNPPKDEFVRNDIKADYKIFDKQ